MEAKLPDVNAGIVTHRKAVMNGYDQGDFIKCAVSFDAIMALLPEDYKPNINTEQYYEKIKGRKILTCDGCDTQHTREIVEPFEMLLSNQDRCIMGVDQCLVWICPSCSNTRPLIGSAFRNEQYQQPFYTGTMPDMPRRKGMHDRIGYSRKFKDWYQIAFREIEYKIGLYRAEYQRQNPDDVVPNLEDA